MKTHLFAILFFCFLCSLNAQNNCLVSRYYFSGNAKDTFGTNHGTVYGATLTNDRFGNSNSAYNFVAANSNYIQIPASQFLTSNYSYSLWVRPTTNPASGGAYIYFSVGSNADQNMQIENAQNNGAMGYLTGFTLTAYNVNSSGTTSTGGVASGSLPSTNTWYHVVCTRDSSNFKVYVNGCLASTSSSYSGTLPYYGTNSKIAKIGARTNGSKFFNGALDDISIYSCALTANEISRLYHLGETFKVSNDTSICADAFKPFKLKASSRYCTYKWIDISNRSTVLSTDSQYTVNITSTKTFRVFNNQGDSLTVKVTILPKPKLNLGNDTAYCGPFSKTLDAGFKNIKSYLWNTSSTNRTIAVSSGAWYSVNITDSNGCKSYDSINIINNPLPISSLQNDTLICGSFSYVLNAGSSAAKFKWDNNDSLQYRTVSSKGKYKVTLTSVFGCIKKDSIVIQNPVIKAMFDASSSVACINTNIFNFKDTSNYVNDQWLKSKWSFGDGTTLIDTVAKKRYIDTGLFVVKLLIQSGLNCYDSITKNIRILPNSKVNFGINSAQQCFNSNSFDFTDSSNGNGDSIVSYNWKFGDLTSSILKNNFDKVYTKDSSYSIQLITTTERNCLDTLVKLITVYPNPVIEYIVSKSEQCFNNHSISIVNNSVIRTGSIDNYNWDFGDGTSSQNISIAKKVYNYHDTFRIRLIAESDFMCFDTSDQYIILFPNANPDFIINNDTQCYEWNRFDFVNASTIDEGTLTYNWSFGDATFSNVKDTFGKIYMQFGIYSVRLITQSNLNCFDTISKIINVLASPIADFDIDNNKQCYRGNVFNFTGTSQINNGLISEYLWDMGDSRTYGLKDVLSLTYNSEDTFNIELIVKSDLGCYDTISNTAITFAQPNLDFIIPNDSQCWQKNFFNIDNRTTLKYGSMSHTWNLGDGTFDYNYEPLTKKYANASASYIVKYNVVSDHGCSDSGSHRIVLLERPIADIIVNDSIQCFRNHLFSFSNNTVFSAMNTVTYEWDYGNGNQSVGFNAQTAVYPNPIYYPVQLIAYSYLTNCYDTMVQLVLPAPHPLTNYSINQDSQCIRSNAFVFSNQTSITMGTLSYNWNFGDQTFSNLTNPTKSYSKGNNYAVKLVATSNHDCKDSISKNIVLVPQPKALFTINDTSQCLNNHSFNLINSSTLLYGTFNSKWIFDNSLEITTKDVINKGFNSSGIHEIKLTLNSDFNCKDTVKRFVTLENIGSTQIAILSNDSQCLKGNQFIFNSSSNVPGVIHQNYNWILGDGSSLQTKNITKKYLAHGNYQILLETISLNSCRDTAYFDLVVHPQPLSSFTATSPCFPNPVIFTNTSSIQSGSIDSYLWSFGDASQSNQINPIHSYSIPGYYSVQLISTSNYSCKDTIVQNNAAYVRKKPIASFTFTRLPDKQFDVSTLKFQNLSTSNIVTSNWNFGDGNFSSDFEPEQDFADTFERTVQLIVTNDEGCTDTAYDKTGALITDFVFYIPDAFSPGSNNINDIFKPIATPYVRTYIMEVFNRWGEKVFSTDDITAGWDGTYQNEDCEQGVYIVRIYLVPMRGKIQSHNTTVTLLR